ncbi:MAG: biopolymer transporter ExbD [Ferruginibacter sp.]
MSTIENSRNAKPSKQKRLNKKNTQVDLTPMVDLGFLLITFFVFTTQLSTPTAMNLNMPFEKVDEGDKICQSCVLTVCLEPGNIIRYYEGMPELNPAVYETSFNTNGIRDIILQKKRAVQNLKNRMGDFVLIIKSADGSTFQNFVDIVDEVAINNVKHYYIDELNDADKMLLAKK